MRPVDPRLLTTATAARRYIATAVIIGTASAVVTIGFAVYVARILSTVISSGASSVPANHWLILALCISCRAALAWGSESIAFASSARAKYQLRQAVLRQALTGNSLNRNEHARSQLATTITVGVDAIDSYFAKYLPYVFLSVTVPVTIGIWIAWSDWLSALLVGITLPLIPLFMILVGLATGVKIERQQRTLHQLSGHFLTIIAGLPTLAIFGRAKAQAQHISDFTDQYRVSTMATLRLAFTSGLVLELLSMLSVAVVAVTIGLRLLAGEVDLSIALAILILAPECYLPLRQLGMHYHASADGMQALMSMLDLIDQKPTVKGSHKVPVNLAQIPIRIDSLTVRYPQAAVAVVQNLSATIEPGTITVVTGPSGCGKTTLLSVLRGSLGWESGAVMVGDCHLHDIDPQLWSQEVSWVPQRSRLLPGSVADSIAIASKYADSSAVYDAADMVGLAAYIDHPAAQLSAGQQHRVALARAIMRKSPLLLLDEPTAALDRDTENLIVDIICSQIPSSTVVAVSHRQALIDRADRVIDASQVRI